jgi:hypothetical protein
MPHVKYEHAANRGEVGNSSFRFKVIKGCRTTLESQVREAVRIQQRGSVLNKRGEFNRFKLTKMDLDMWDKQCWDHSMAQRRGMRRRT